MGGLLILSPIHRGLLGHIPFRHFCPFGVTLRLLARTVGLYRNPPTASAFLSDFQNIVSFSCGGGVWSYDPSFESLLQPLSESASYDVFSFAHGQPRHSPGSRVYIFP
jgi:hypothetical protein